MKKIVLVRNNMLIKCLCQMWSTYWSWFVGDNIWWCTSKFQELLHTCLNNNLKAELNPNSWNWRTSRWFAAEDIWISDTSMLIKSTVYFQPISWQNGYQKFKQLKAFFLLLFNLSLKSNDVARYVHNLRASRYLWRLRGKAHIFRSIQRNFASQEHTCGAKKALKFHRCW